jgi:prepilin-type N-terminal cleavage/methylation domain-containing protein
LTSILLSVLLIKNMKLFNKSSRKGFTLIELLIVIAILGVMAAAVLAAINPITKINQAKDSNIKSDVSAISNAMQAYYTGIAGGGTNPSYPAALSSLAPNELKVAPAAAYLLATAPASCTSATCTSAAVYATLASDTTKVWCWKSDGTAPASITTGTCTAP